VRRHSTEVANLPGVTPEAEQALRDYRQGQIVGLGSIAIDTSSEGSVEEERRLPSRIFSPLKWRSLGSSNSRPGQSRFMTPEGVVVLSQTCDIVQVDRRTVQVAPVVGLTGDWAREAASGHRPRYVALPGAGEDKFGDLECIATVHKNDLVDIDNKPGVTSHREERLLAFAIGRRFTRFPFPDELHPWLRPLETVLQEKARRPASPIGQALQRVSEIRIFADGGWSEPAPYNLTVVIIVEEGTLPYARDDDLPPITEALSKWLRRGGAELIRAPGPIAEKLMTATRPEDKYHLWLALAEAWASQCRPTAEADQSVLDAVDSIDAELVTENELTVDRWWASEALDLDYLSSPRPG
jgi:hypothetical protein